MSLDQYLRATADQVHKDLDRMEHRLDPPGCAVSTQEPDARSRECNVEVLSGPFPYEKGARIASGLCTSMANGSPDHVLERGMYFGGKDDPTVLEFAVTKTGGTDGYGTTDGNNGTRTGRIKKILMANSLSVSIQMAHLFHIHFEDDITRVRELLGGANVDCVMCVYLDATPSMYVRVYAEVNFAMVMSEVEEALRRGRNGRHCNMNHEACVDKMH